MWRQAALPVRVQVADPLPIGVPDLLTSRRGLHAQHVVVAPHHHSLPGPHRLPAGPSPVVGRPAPTASHQLSRHAYNAALSVIFWLDAWEIHVDHAPPSGERSRMAPSGAARPLGAPSLPSPARRRPVGADHRARGGHMPQEGGRRPDLPGAPGRTLVLVLVLVLVLRIPSCSDAHPRPMPPAAPAAAGGRWPAVGPQRPAAASPMPSGRWRGTRPRTAQQRQQRRHASYAARQRQRHTPARQRRWRRSTGGPVPAPSGARWRRMDGARACGGRQLRPAAQPVQVRCDPVLQKPGPVVRSGWRQQRCRPAHPRRELP